MSSSKANTIKHEGVVESVTGQMVRVRVLQASACSSCSAAQLCRSSETKEKTIDAFCADRPLPAVGETVVVEGKTSQGMLATLWAYVVPLVVLMVVLMIVTKLVNEGVGALAALGSLVPYYGILYLFRNKLQKRLMFSVK